MSTGPSAAAALASSRCPRAAVAAARRRLAALQACGVAAVAALGLLAAVALLQVGARADDDEGGPSLLRALLPQQLADAPAFSLAGMGDGPHKPFYPLNQSDIVTIGLAALGLIVAAGGGIGGGGILVPLYILVLGFSPKRAIPLSNVTILGGSIANVIAGVRNRHPYADRPLLDFTLIMMMEPTTIVGAVVGSFANKVLPALAVSVLLVLVLSALAHRTLKKGFQQLEKEGGLASLCAVGDRWARRHARLRRREDSGGLHPEEEDDDTPSPASRSGGSSAVSLAGENDEVEEILLSARRAGPPKGGLGRAAVLVDEGTGLLGDERLRRPQLATYSYLPTTAITRGGRGASPHGTGAALPRRFSYAGGEALGHEEDEDEDNGLNEEDVPPEILSTRSVSFLGSPSHRAWPLAAAASFDSPSRRPHEQGGAFPAAVDKAEAGAGGASGKGEVNPALAAILDLERGIPLWKPATLTACFLGILVVDVLKGGEGAPSPLGFTCGSLGYWLVTLSALPWVGLFFVGIRRRVLDEHEAKVKAGYEFHPGDIQWTPTSTVKFPMICVLAGLFAGIFGVGGGIVKGPLMLEMGVLPPVAAASAACMIMYTSAAASAAYYVFGLIPMDYGLFFFCFGFCCTAIGQAAVTMMLRKYRRESFIVLSIGAVILLSACLMGFQAVTDFVADPKGAAAFSSLCGGR